MFAPLQYAYRSITIWHWLVLLCLAAPAIWGIGQTVIAQGPIAPHLTNLLEVIAPIVWMYFLAAPIIGQVYGDTYPFDAIWPSALVMGTTMAALFAGFILLNEQGLAAFLAFCAALPFLALFALLVWWAAPRVVSKPSRKRAWAVRWGVRV